MLDRQNDKHLINSMDDTRQVVHDFKLRMPYENYRTKEYALYHKLLDEEMLPRIDQHLEKLFSGEVDDGNGDMLDSILFSPAREAKPDLAKQHVDHEDMIRRLIVRRKADIADFEAIAENLKNELSALQAEYDQTSEKLTELEKEKRI